ncbi:MAG: nickel-dependent lactate racemase [Candidatus Sumerlaeia bacterium]|nr:nickel-dependent lactate racemase [Candidatus Sumerlaeia bacterium]
MTAYMKTPNTVVEIPFGNARLAFEVPADNLAWIASPNPSEPIADLRAAVRHAIRAPIASPALPELVRQCGTDTVLLVDDSTRSTPQSLILPILLDELNAAGVPDRDITAIIALGTHRPMSLEECADRFGRDVVRRIRVENLPTDPAEFRSLGTTPLGVPISVYRRYLDSGLSIAIGNIIPHMYAGWAGGAKMVQPGISNAETTAKTHLMAGPRVYEILGEVENPVRKEMEQIAVETGLKFIVNVVLNREGEVVEVVAGDSIAAHRAGVEVARKVYTVPLPERADIVVASSHPADRDLWQGFKAVNNSGMLVRDGGTLLLAIPAPEGIAPDHPELMRMGTTPAPQVLDKVARGKIADGVAAATYLALDRTRSRVNVVLVTENISNDEAAEIGLAATPDIHAALAAALKRHGPHARIGVVTHGADIMGRFS